MEPTGDAAATAAGWSSCMSGEILVRRSDGGVANEGGVIEMETPSLGQIVVCNLRGFLLRPSQDNDSVGLFALERASDTPFEILFDQRYQVGEGDAIPGLELSLKFMPLNVPHKMRSTAKFAYGSEGRMEVNSSSGGKFAVIPPDSALEYEVTIAQFGDFLDDDDENGQGQEQRSDVYKFCKEALTSLSLRKECGNRWFSFGDWSRAARSYSKGLQQLDSFLGNVDGATLVAEGANIRAVYDSILSLKPALLSNLSSCHLSRHEYAKAKETCIAVLEFEPTNLKALLRAARASLGLHEHDEARLCLTRLLELDPSNAAGLQEMKRLKEAVKVSRIAETAFAKSMIKAANKTDKTGTTGTTGTTGKIGKTDKADKTDASEASEAKADLGRDELDAGAPKTNTNSHQMVIYILASIITLVIAVRLAINNGKG